MVSARESFDPVAAHQPAGNTLTRSNSVTITNTHHFLRGGAATAAAIICLLLAWTTASMGYSRLLARYGIFTGFEAPVNRSVELSPADAEAYYARSIVFKGRGEIDKAVKELAHAIDLRPRDYFLWLTSGALRDQIGDESGAQRDFNEAVRLAPFYAQPHWQLGNLLLRMGKFDDAFIELRLAAGSDPKLVRPLIDIAWMTYGGDVEAVKSATQPATQDEEFVLAHFFARHGRADEALKLFRQGKVRSAEQRRDLLAVLLEANEYRAAYEIWTSGKAGDHAALQSGLGTLPDGGFENDIDWNDPGFGWQKGMANSNVKISSDKEVSREGKRSLLLDWAGDNDPSKPVLTHLVLLEPEGHYRLHFSARTENLVGGSLPVIVVREAGLNGAELVQSQPLGRGTNEWREYSVDFATSRTTQAVLLALHRQNCNGEVCPIFGLTWFDLVWIEKLPNKG